MRRFFLLITLIMFVNASQALADCFGTSCLPREAKNACSVNKSNGCIDWENGVIYAVGMGVPNPKFKSQAQKRYSAYQAARVVAMRNLLQMVQDVNIDSSTTVKDGMLESDMISTQISGKLRHVQEAGEPKTMNDGSMWVTMKMYLRDIMTVLINNDQMRTGRDSNRPIPETQPTQPASVREEVKKKSEYGGSPDVVYSGLIIDARGLNITPAMSPKVHDSNGVEVYGSAAIDRNFAIRYGVIAYVKDMGKAKQNDRVQGNPLILKARKTSGRSTDVTISNEDAKLLRQLEKTQSFLREARVVLIL